MLLHHGTTRNRAEAIIANGPDPDFQEPGEYTKAEGFSTAPPGAQGTSGDPEKIARGKAAKFGEGGPVILELDVPDDIVARSDNLIDEVRFNPGYGLEELLAAWPT